MMDTLGAFVPGSQCELPGSGSGPLRGLTFAAKDLYDIAGHVTGFGNPDWAETHDPAEATSPAVQAWLDAGAHLVGKTITDELAYSLNGQNFHYGTPTNANAPGRIPGGSSSGSASAVAGGLVDIALGSDTGGSVRIPASYCGLYGIRPTHGRIPVTGVLPLAPSFDTVGWFARDAGLLARAGEVLLGTEVKGVEMPPRLLRIDDAFALASDAANAALTPFVERLEGLIGKAKPFVAGEPGGGLLNWMLRFRHIQAREICETHGAWLAATKPRFGPEIAERFAWAQSVPQSEADAAKPEREAFTARLRDALPDGTVACLPTAPGIAPKLDTSAEDLVAHRGQVIALTAIAGLAGLPQVTMPLANIDGCPLGLSIIAGPGQDVMLLALAESMGADQGAGSDRLGIS